jgi:4-hydroxybenzoate-CoA ligase
VPSAVSENHLLWPTIGANLACGRGDEIAIYSGAREISYAELAGAALAGGAQIDRLLAPGSRVLIADRDQRRVAVALCAVLASRSIPLLADPTSSERLARIVAEWGVRAAIVAPEITIGGVEGIAMDAVERWLGAGGAQELVLPAVEEDDAAFWTFTSGTTGEPTAVVHPHRGPRAAFAAFGRTIVGLGPEDVTIATAGLPFVYALGNNFFFPLMAGGGAVLPADLLLPTVLGELVRHGATVLVAGPWSLSAIAERARRPRWVEALRRLRCVLAAGEPLPPRVFHEWKRGFGKEIIDNLGCTEMFNSFVSHRRGEARPGSLGQVVEGYELRVGGQPPAPGARGELAVRGPSRAIAAGRRGEMSPLAGEWCETGDEVEIDAAGGVTFLGRGDDRFKVKGRFLHPIEVERVLGADPAVRECLVLPEIDASGLTVVVAKIVPAAAQSGEALVRGVMRRAREGLESYAVPARIDVVESLPRNERGKVQRRVRA